jgi:uncharacterized protein
MLAKTTLIQVSASLVALAVFSTLADPATPVVQDAVADLYRPLDFDQQKLAGVLAERMRATREGYLERVNIRALLASLRSDARSQSGLAEQVGKFLEAAANAYDYSRDPNLKSIMDTVASELVSTHPPSDVAACRAELLGFLAYYRLTSAESALTVSKKIGNLLVANLRSSATGDQQSLPTVIDSLVYLYRYTGDNRYLDFCKRIARTSLQSVPAASSLQDRLAALTGLLELYRVTGVTSYYTQVVTAWPTVRRDSLFLLASSESSRTQEFAEIADACTIANWIELTLELLRLTGQAQYGEELERVIYNELFASQDPKTGNLFSEVPVNGSKKPASATRGCAPSESMGISLIPSAAWGRSANGIAVILYTAGRAAFHLRRRGSVQLYSEATYPATGDILLHVEPAHNIQFPLRLRVPAWTNSFVADVRGSHLVGKPGDYLVITREWKRGDTVKITMSMTVAMIEAAGEHAPYIAIRRGPQILALSRPLNPAIEDLAAAGIRPSHPSELRPPPSQSGFPANWAGNQTYVFPGEYNGKPQQLTLVPFSDAIAYRVWIRKP